MINETRGRRDPWIGRELAGRYLVEEVLGEGAIGVVYLARHHALGSSVAVKRLHGPWARLPEYRARFLREARLLAQLRHPNVVSVLDYGEEDGAPYLVMEKLEGDTLRAKMSAGLIPMERVLEISEEILSVLAVMHVTGIVHRDLKPENVMLSQTADGKEHVKVYDFGLAYADDQPSGIRLTEPNTVRGTPLYMSPEQCRAHPPTSASDVYSLGVMLYEMLSGVLPFGATGSTDVMMQHVLLEPPMMEERGRRPVPDKLERLVLTLLAKTAAKRPTAEAVRRQLVAIRAELFDHRQS
ncbi:MAG: serine/threonine-protein kinase [Deltaproteobacteria bacterium]|nr:serine/threonine-protein kinase [Deltaproteobacteria bacterium]